LEKDFAWVLAAFLKIAVNRSRVIGRIFFRVSSSGSKVFLARFIDLLYHAPRALRIEKAEWLLNSRRASAANRQLQAG
jgi:hypothetical protein